MVHAASPTGPVHKPSPYKIDMHTHILPKGWPNTFEGVDLCLKIFEEEQHKRPEFKERVPFEKGTGFTAQMEWRSTGKLFRKCKANLFDYKEVIRDMDCFGIDLQVLSTVPVMFNYQLNPTIGAEWSRFLNQDMGKVCKSSNGRLLGLGTLPLQDPELAAKELERSMGEDYGMKGIQIGSHVNMPKGEKNMYLYDRRLDPVWATAEKLGVGILVHPWDMDWCDDKYWLPWLVGMPAEMSLSMCHIMLSGILQRFPKIKFMFAHGGGAVPGTLGRIEWGFKCRPDLVACDVLPDQQCPHYERYQREHVNALNADPGFAEYKESGVTIKHFSPQEAIKNLYVDTITHDPYMLKKLMNTVPLDHIALGSDYPFPLGEVPSKAPGSGEVLDVYPGEMVENLDFCGYEEKSQMLYKTGAKFLNISEKEIVKHDSSRGFRCTDRYEYL